MSRDQLVSSIVILAFSPHKLFLSFLSWFCTVFLYSLPWVENLSVAVLVLFSNISKSSHGRVFFHIKVFLGSVLIWTPWDLKRRWTKFVFDSFAMFCPCPCPCPCSVAVLASKSSHGRVLFHIKVVLGSVLISTPWDLKRRRTKFVFDSFATICPQWNTFL